MLLENLPSSLVPLWIFLISFALFSVLFFLISYLIWKKYVNKDTKKIALKKVFWYSLGGGLGCSLFIVILFCSLVPTVVVVDEDFKVKEDYFIYSNGSIVGISGIYIENQSNRYLNYVVVDSKSKEYTRIPSYTRVKVPRLPERYFEDVPTKQKIYYNRNRRGRTTVTRGPSIYLTY